MKLSIVLLTVCMAGGVAMSVQSAQLRQLDPVPFTQVKITDKFWAPRIETNRKVSIPHNLKMLEKVGNIKNLELAAAGERTGFKGMVFQDSDIYKVIEAASFSLATNPDPELDKQLDGIIAKLAAAQMPDGYLDTYYQINEPDRRFTNLRDNHEMYCAGHMIEAAVAHYQATGKRNFLDVAIKVADNLVSKFGSEPGKRMGYCGHPEIELALMKLWRATGDERYFKLSEFFVENRGTGFFAEEHKGDGEREIDFTYWLDNAKIKDQTSIVGHAVRAAYLLSGATDVAGVNGDNDILNAINRIWRNTTEKRMFITGGIGPSASNEGFTIDYDLPTTSAYQETCASIAMAMWNQRLALLYGNARYADYVEQALYNGTLSGVSLKGDTFFYQNPLGSNGNHHRTPWFECACCPPNVIRTIASIGGYAYATSKDSVWLNLYIQGSVECKVGGTKVKLNVATDYPWDGAINVRPVVSSPATFAVRLRVPGWCNSASVKVNGKVISEPMMDSGYIVIERRWSKGDSIDLNLPMPIRRIEANPQVRDTLGAAVIQRGPIVYCLEGCDQPVPLKSIALPLDAKLAAKMQPNMLGGIVTITGEGKAISISDWSGKLYRDAIVPDTVKVTAIPYYAWDNREACPMAVWVPTSVRPAGGLEAFAKAEASFSQWGQPAAINDGKEVRNSSDSNSSPFGWWPHQGTSEWISYKWDRPVSVGGVKVYWFVDPPEDNEAGNTPQPGFRRRKVGELPESWHIEYLDGTEWKPVAAQSVYPINTDEWCQVMFAPVKTTSLKLVVKMKDKATAAIHEWKVLPPDGLE